MCSVKISFGSTQAVNRQQADIGTLIQYLNHHSETERPEHVLYVHRKRVKIWLHCIMFANLRWIGAIHLSRKIYCGRYGAVSWIDVPIFGSI